MIEVREIGKSFGNIKAIDHVTTTIQDGQIFGLVGSNGAGKSTFLRMISGVIKADEGEILVDGKPVFECTETKEEICMLADTAYFLPNTNGKMMRDYYALVYPKFNKEQFDSLAEKFRIDLDRKVNTFSKGMKKQLSMMLGVCANTKYLLCDETFDGLDPVMRQAVKSLFAGEVINREFTPVIASHNLRELEDICDSIGLLHKGGILFTKDLEDMKFHIHKVQCVIQNPLEEERLLENMDVLQHEKRGSLLTFIARGTREKIVEQVEQAQPVFVETVPLSLEEIFISEMEVEGYDIKKFIC